MKEIGEIVNDLKKTGAGIEIHVRNQKQFGFDDSELDMTKKDAIQSHLLVLGGEHGTDRHVYGNTWAKEVYLNDTKFYLWYKKKKTKEEKIEELEKELAELKGGE